MTSLAGADDIVDSVEQSFSQLFRLVRANLQEAAAIIDPEIQPAGWHVLRYIAKHAPAPTADIIAATGMDKTQVSRQLRALRERGLVRVEHDASDARIQLVSPTEEATRRLATVFAMWNERFRGFLGTWDEEELATFARLLARFVDDAPAVMTERKTA